MKWIYYDNYQYLFNVSQIVRMHIDADCDGIRQYLWIDTSKSNEQLVSEDECVDLDDLLADVAVWLGNGKKFSDVYEDNNLCSGNVLILDRLINEVNERHGAKNNQSCANKAESNAVLEPIKQPSNPKSLFDESIRLHSEAKEMMNTAQEMMNTAQGMIRKSIILHNDAKNMVWGDSK